MRRTPRTILVVTAPLLLTLGLGCAKQASHAVAPSYRDAVPSDAGADAPSDAPSDAQIEGQIEGRIALPDAELFEDDLDEAPGLSQAQEYDSSTLAEVESAPASEPPMRAPAADAPALARRARGNRRSERASRRSSRARNRSGSGGALAKARSRRPAPPLSVATPPPAAPSDGTESYGHIQENEFIAVTDDPLSTFSIDVDTASYSNTRRLLREGRLPPPDAVRIEELVNYFDYDYEPPRGDAPFSVATEVAPCPWNDAHQLVHVGLQGKDVAAHAVPPRNLVFLLDVSGSMSDGDKLPLLKQGMHMLADQIREQDRVSIVVYAGASGVVLDPTSDRETIRLALSRLEAGGSTNGGAGIELAYRLATQNFVEGGINRVILATDGDFNVGVTSQGALIRLIERKRESGVFLSVLGFGRGNLKDSTMEQLADKGNGNYAYIDSTAEAHKVLVEQAGATLMTIAKDVKIQVEFNPAEIAAYRLVGYENRKLAHRDFNDDTKDAGEIGAGHTVTALYEVVPVGQGTAPQVDALKYQEGRAALSAAAGSGELMTVKLRYKKPRGLRSTLLSVPVVDTDGSLADSSADFRFSAAVAEMGLLLRGSKWRADASWGQVYELAQSAQGRDPHGRRAEMLRLVRQAAALQGEDLVARGREPQLAR